MHENYCKKIRSQGAFPPILWDSQYTYTQAYRLQFGYFSHITHPSMADMMYQCRRMELWKARKILKFYLMAMILWTEQDFDFVLINCLVVFCFEMIYFVFICLLVVFCVLR
eukprot:TRINITY_DN6654_c0_g3_i1.p4 TRINITY_DN6654_c0_g3~~TRINITY_DN6654_c0_g3_i1.p4  ORF type:complete len:111 (-),score=0.29 TRINITY_DN6654_c0_g3_i1:161-493(-)